jgi:hypothetical protein
MKNQVNMFLLFAMVSIGLCSTSYSQERPITGFVTTFDSIPIVWADSK